MGSGNPQILSAPGGETMRQTTKRFRGAITCSWSSITIPSLVWLGFHLPPGWQKNVRVFLSVRHAFLSVTLRLSITLLNVRVYSPDFAMKTLKNRNDFDALG